MTDTQYAAALAAGIDPVTGTLLYDREYIQDRLDIYKSTTREDLRRECLWRIASHVEVILPFDDLVQIFARGIQFTPEQEQRIKDWIFSQFKVEL